MACHRGGGGGTPPGYAHRSRALAIVLFALVCLPNIQRVTEDEAAAPQRRPETKQQAPI